jgi:hypothetical protein
VFYAVVAAAFQDVGKADDVAVDVGKRVLDGVAHAGLCSQIDDSLWFVCFKAGFDGIPIREINP